jgi:hypothetical protein
MQASAWNNGTTSYGIRVGSVNRDQFFERDWTEIEVEVDGTFYPFALRESFWRDCPEFRDRDSRVIRNWLERHHSLDWPTGNPPQVKLLPLGGNRFRLLP